MKNFIKTIIACFVLIGTSYGQSNFCATATPIALTAGSACVNGTTLGATSANFLYGGCNATSVNEVWYTYTATGANNDFTINSLGLTNCEIVIYSGGCPAQVGGGTLEICNASVGVNAVNASWGFAPGTQIWIGVMSNSGIEGNFQLCIDSYASNPVGGNFCSIAIPICAIGTTTTVDMSVMGSTGTFPSCFWAAVNRDVWFTFTCTVSGTIEWTATPQNANELDWAMYNTTLGCPGSLVACNYSYDLANGSPIGMNDGISCVACPTDVAVGACGEYCGEYFVTAGQTYSIMVDIFSGTIGDLDFGFTNGTTAQIAPVADFTVSPSVVCGPDMSVTITDNSIGNPPSWTFGNGNTSIGSNPAPEFYNTPGTYAITATVSDPQCASTYTQFIQLLAPLSGGSLEIDETCPLACNGSSVADFIAGGDGVYSYEWFDNLMNPIGQNSSGATGLCAGNYTLQVSSSTCPNYDIPVTINSFALLDDPSFTMTSSCDGGVSNVSGASGGTFTFNTPPGDAAVLDPNTGSITSGTPGATYDVLYTTSGTCPSNSIQTVTALLFDDPSFNLTSTCDGGTAVITGTGGGTFTFNTPPGDAAIVNPTTGEVTGGTSGSTYDVLYTTNGSCSASANLNVTAILSDDPTFAMTATCDGGIAVVSGTAGGTFLFNTPPGDGAVIDPVTGEITSGTSGTQYDVLYTTNGVCWLTSTQLVTVTSQDDPAFALTPTCDGATAIVSGLSGGTFTFTNAPTDGAVIDPFTGEITGGTPSGSYDVTYTTNGTCFNSLDLTIVALPFDDASFSITPTCDGGISNVSGASGGTFTFNTPPGDAAVLDSNTGIITSGTSGATYDVLYTTSGTCPTNSIQTVTALLVDDPSFNLTSTCDGGTAVITGTGGGTFTFNTPPGDAAIVNPTTGEVTGGTSGFSYDVLYTTNGSCPASANLNVTAILSDDPTFAMTANCDGGIAVVSGTAGGTFLFNTPPGDGAVIDPVTGEITNGTSGTQYDVLYTTNGVCWLTSTQLVTVTSQDDPAFALTPTCDGATAIVSGLSGGTFTFTNVPTDGAVIDPFTGEITGGTPGTIYDVMYTTTGVCPSNLVQQVTAYSLPFAPNAGTDITYCSSDFFDDMTANGGAGIFKWYDESGSLMGVGSLMQPYDLVGVNSYYVSETMNGCEGPLSIVVITVEECDILIPTAFTPAGYPNSVWEILNLDNVYPNNVVQIYNRWGSLIYESEPGKYDLNPWDGTYKGELQPVSSYYYIIEFNDKNNESAKGTVTLILNN